MCSWGKQNWQPWSSAEQLATRQRVAVFDQTSFTKYLVAGPDAEAALQWLCTNELRYSWSRSIASSEPSSAKTRATNTPSGVVTLKFRFVSPPGSSVTRRGRPARLGTWASTTSAPVRSLDANPPARPLPGQPTPLYRQATRRSHKSLDGNEVNFSHRDGVFAV
jgi:hypothetical protein